jgi:HNH endonuclease
MYEPQCTKVAGWSRGGAGSGPMQEPGTVGVGRCSGPVQEPGTVGRANVLAWRWGRGCSVPSTHLARGSRGVGHRARSWHGGSGRSAHPPTRRCDQPHALARHWGRGLRTRLLGWRPGYGPRWPCSHRCGAVPRPSRWRSAGQPGRPTRPTRRPGRARRGLWGPGRCPAPAWGEAHHRWPWRDGGPTDLANLALVCRAHHRAVHEGGWQLQRDPGGQFTATPPTEDTDDGPPQPERHPWSPPAGRRGAGNPWQGG